MGNYIWSEAFWDLNNANGTSLTKYSYEVYAVSFGMVKP